MDDDKKPTSSGSRAPLVITIVVLALVGGAYYAYYRKQVEYFTGRNLRLLGMLTAQVEGRVEMLEGFVRAQDKADAQNKTDNTDHSGKNAERAYSATRIRFGDCVVETPSIPPTPSSDTDEVRRGIEETSQGWRVRLQAHDGQKARTCATIAIDDMARPIFAGKAGAAFDMLLVAKDDGTVLYSVRPPPASSKLLGNGEEWIDEGEEPPPTEAMSATTTQTNAADAPGSVVEKTATTATASAATTTTTTASATAGSPKMSAAIGDRESGSTLLITSLMALSKRKAGWRSDYEPVDAPTLATLARATNEMNVAFGGDDYVLFTQPYTFSRVPGSVDKQSQWIVCGLVSASRFRYEVSAVSTSIVLIAIAIVLLALCCWPYLRIALIGPSQALTITDVVLIIMCTIIGAAVITLALLDGFAYRGITQTADNQIEQFSHTVNDDFQRNVAWAMDVLWAAEKLTYDEAKGHSQQPTTRPLPASLMRSAEVTAYPYIDSIAWIDDAGMQRVRFARNRTPPSDVSMRRYFQLAKLQRTWSLPDYPEHPYVLEWVSSKSTGEVRAVLAKKTEEAVEWDAVSHPPNSQRPPFTVITLSTELIDISHAVRPPGVQMAIIDENGEVIYHSDTQRIGYENFFAEADRDRELRSAVVARRAGPVNTSYWGEDQSMYVMPLTGSSWTLVTFREKRLTRVLNVEATLLTLVMLLFSATPYFILYIVVLVLKPGYRAPRLWPDEARHDDYLRLSLILIALLLLFCLNNYMLMPWSSFYGILIIPLLANVTTYLVLHRTGAPRRFAIGKAVWLVVTAMLFAHMLLASMNSERFFSDYAGLVKAILIAISLAVAVLTFLLIGGWKGEGTVADALRALRSRFGYSTLYRFCGVLMLAIGVALPVAGFFAISRHVESVLMVKYGQLRAAADLEQRVDHVVTLNALPPDVPPASSRYVYSDILSNRLGFLFGGRWKLDPPVTNAPPWPGPTKEPEVCSSAEENEWTIPLKFSNWVPALYEDSVAIQPLFESGSADNLWHWCVNGRIVKLVRKIHFDRDVAQFVWARNEPDVASEKIVIVSRLPRASFWKSSAETKRDAQDDDPAETKRDAQDDDPESPAWLHLGTIVLIALPLSAIFWYAVGFIAKRVLLIDIHEPDWLARKPLSPSLGDHIFLVRRDRDVNTLTSGVAFVDVSFEAIDQSDHWVAVLETLDSDESGLNMRIVDFEYGINDGVINEKKLQWLERLLAFTSRNVIIVSSVSPAYTVTTPAPPSLPADGVAAYCDRWRALLDCFVCVTAEELDLRHEEWQRRNDFRTISQLYAAGPKTWLEKETAYNSFLRHICKELEAATALHNARQERDPDTDRRRLLDELGERAETYFAGLWATCREEEKLLLYQLAHSGLANAKNRRTLRRLMARGLVRRDPNLELFSESFRLYVLDTARRENIIALDREKRGASTWDSLRLPFFIIIISFILLLFATQKDMLTTTTALATGLTTGLPILMKLIGVFTDRRADAKV